MYSNVQNVDLHLLRVFSAIVECGGFSAAQAKLNMSQSTISTHMATLEIRLGCRLCERGKKGFRLTEKGKHVLRAKEELFASLDSFVDQIRGLDGHLIGNLSIGILDNTITLNNFRLSQALARFHRRDQNVHIQFFVKSPHELEEDVLNGQLHAAITYIGHRLPNLRYIDLFREKISIYCGKNHPLFIQKDISADDLKNHPWIKRGYLLPNSLLSIKPQYLTSTAYHMEPVAYLILAGSHLGYLPQHYAAQWVTQNKMRALKPDTLSYEVEHSLITRYEYIDNEALNAFLSDIIYEHTPEMLQKTPME